MKNPFEWESMMKPTRKITKSISFAFLVTLSIWLSIPFVTGLWWFLKDVWELLTMAFHMLLNVKFVWFIPVCFVVIAVAHYFLVPDSTLKNKDFFDKMFR